MAAPVDSDDYHPSVDICPCCGFQRGFDYLAEGVTYEALREKWIAGGCKWWSPTHEAPPGWDPKLQLQRLSV